MAASFQPDRVSVIVVNYNRSDLLNDCLRSLLEQRYGDLEIIVVDNGSTDGSPAMVAREFPSVRLESINSNQGFARANNIGFGLSSGEYLITLNNDTIVQPDFVEQMVAAARQDDRIGSVASLMVFHDRPWMVNSAGVSVDRLGIAWDRLGGHPLGDAQRAGWVFGACAGAALYRRRMLEDVGLFDEAYYCYLEDVDLAWRANLRGWRFRYQPAAVVRHVHSATAGEHSPTKRYLLSRNKIRLLVKNYPTPDFLVYLPLIVVYDIALMTIGALLAGRRLPIRSRLATLAGRLVGLTRIADALEARRQVQSRRTMSSSEVLSLLEPIPTPAEIAARYRHLVPDHFLPSVAQS